MSGNHWMFVAFLLLAISSVLAILNLSAWREGFRAGKRRASVDGYGVDLAAFIPALTRHLDIQADGGDSPEAFVRYAVSQALQDMRRAQQESSSDE